MLGDERFSSLERPRQKMEIQAEIHPVVVVIRQPIDSDADYNMCELFKTMKASNLIEKRADDLRICGDGR
ncbi:hypothetical protein E3N88_03215 [Mikania micrantha]|uniref:Uncharacterized protein n=1 Tax=Mikania micrantha TaxID=192012 RepID=A0A5N6Q630_9ASTR|nr:hypothetical protein E3N88_03215 [Mikania micrantha]